MTLLTLILSVFISSTSFAAVWDVENQWSESWETAYSDWLENNWDVDSLSAPDKVYSNVKVDCADAVYATRVIFSYENKLPFAMKDPTGGGNVISQAMSRWDGIPAEKRLRQFLFLIFGTGGTMSLPGDTYPIAINRQWVRPGTILLVDKTNHHSWTIKSISETGVPVFIYSTRPARTKLSKKVGMPHTEYVFPRGIRVELHAGFRNFRKPDEIRLPIQSIAGYSEDQYSVPKSIWRSSAQTNLARVQETLAEKLERSLESVCKAAQDRVAIVNGTQEFLATFSKKCMDAGSYDDHSTPSRDMRLKQDYEDLMATYQNLIQAGAQNSVPTDVWARAQALANRETAETAAGSWCAVNYAPDRTISLGELYTRTENNLLSSNPHDTIDYRWGEKAGHTKRAKECPEYH